MTFDVVRRKAIRFSIGFVCVRMMLRPLVCWERTHVLIYVHPVDKHHLAFLSTQNSFRAAWPLHVPVTRPSLTTSDDYDDLQAQ